MVDDAAREERRKAAAEHLTALGRKVRRLRRDRDLTQEALADLMGVDRRVVAYIEAGQRDFGVSLMWPLAAGLGTSVADLLPE